LAQEEGETQTKQIPASAALEAQAPANPAPEGVPDSGSLEAQSLSRGLTLRDLRREADEREYDRSQLFKANFEIMAIIAFWVLFFVFLAVGLVWALHLITPQWGWLGHDQIDNLQGLLTGGVIAGILADHVRRRMS
jgi:hypothetical protein